MNVAKVAHLTGHSNAIYSLEKSIYQNNIYSSSADGFIVEWDIEKKGDGKLIANIQKPIYSLLTLNKAQQLFCGTSEGNLHLIDLIQNKETRNIEAHTLGLFDLQKISKHLISAGGDGFVCIWNIDDLSLLHKIKVADKSCRVIAVSPDEKTIAIGSSDSAISIFETENFELIHKIEAHKNSVFALSYSPDGINLVSSGRDAMLKVFDIANQYAIVMDIPSHTAQVKCISYNNSGKLLATSSMDKTIKIWNAQNFELIKVIDKERNDSHTNCINKLLWMNDETLVSCSDDRAVMVWKILKEDII